MVSDFLSPSLIPLEIEFEKSEVLHEEIFIKGIEIDIPVTSFGDTDWEGTHHSSQADHRQFS